MEKQPKKDQESEVAAKTRTKRQKVDRPKYHLIAIFLFLNAYSVLGQEVSTIDIVKANANYEQEVMYFYRENWETFRKLALKEGVISGYELYKTSKDSTDHFQLILITTYEDSLQLSQSEDNFRPIMKAVSPNGPKLLKNVHRQEFLEYLIGYEAISVVSNEKARKRKGK